LNSWTESRSPQCAPAATFTCSAIFFDRHSPALLDFLQQQRLQRIERVREMVARLAANGIELNADAIVQPAIENPAKSAGRPWIARALVAAGVVADANEAFAKWLSRGRPGYVPRAAASPAEVFARIHDAGGIASLAHPSLVGQDSWIDEFASHGLDAVEAYHSEHDQPATARYLAIAARLNLLVTGGSDYHGDSAHGPTGAGSRLATARSVRSSERCGPDQEKPQSHRVTEIARASSSAFAMLRRRSLGGGGSRDLDWFGGWAGEAGRPRRLRAARRTYLCASVARW
jgi:predicted metal-dependent phosphoesterase TrpH